MAVPDRTNGLSRGREHKSAIQNKTKKDKHAARMLSYLFSHQQLRRRRDALRNVVLDTVTKLRIMRNVKDKKKERKGQRLRPSMEGA